LRRRGAIARGQLHPITDNTHHQTDQDDLPPYDKLDDIHANGAHDYLKYLKFGYGRATDDASNEIVKTLLPNIAFRMVMGATPERPKKPDPSAALEIAARLDIPPEDFLFIGDTSIDMQTACAAPPAARRNPLREPAPNRAQWAIC